MSGPVPGADVVESPARPPGQPGEPSDPPLVAAQARPTGRPPGPRPSALAVVVVSSAALLYGVLLHVWLLVHLPVWGDEAIVGLMARAIDGGHVSAFYWGQHYGGLEPYLVAAALKVGGGGEPALNATPAVLAAVGAGLVAAVVLAAGRSRLLALAAAATVFVWPYVVVWQSVREGGFREATLCCGLAALLCCIRAYAGRAGPGTFLVLGLAGGLGWWASPEIVYFVLPCLVLFVGWWHGTRRSARVGSRAGGPAPGRWTPLALVALGAAVGSLPWWYANAHTGFASLQRSSFPNNGGVTYASKLSVFFHFMLPMQLGLRAVLTGAWVGGPAVGHVLYALVLVLVVAAVLRAVQTGLARPHGLAPLALAAGVVAYPFLYAAAPGTAYWLDGRYGIYLPSLLVALFGVVLAQALPAPEAWGGDDARDRVPTRPRLGRGRHARPAPVRNRAAARVCAVVAVGVAGALCVSVAGAHGAGVPASPAFFSGWRSGDDPMQHVVEGMRAHHITAAYGDYWTAYDLDFLSGGSPVVSPSRLDVQRSSSIAAAVAASRDPAWLFFAPEETAQAAKVFLNPQPGPGPYTEQTFEARLRQLGVRYTVVRLGLLDAVVPSRRITAP